MTPATLALIISLIEEAIKLEPSVVAEFQAIFNNPNPTAADWLALRTKILSESFGSLAPDVKLS